MFVSRILALTLLLVAAPLFAAERAVDITAADGMKLKASYFAAAKPGPGVLLLHQCNRQRKVWDGLARQLAEAGINVLTLDLRGFGDSGGEAAAKLTPQQQQAEVAKWPSDIDKAFEYLVAQEGVKRDWIGVGGASCGVNNSVQTAVRHPEVKSLVLLSGSTDLNGRNFLRKNTSVPVFFAIADDDEFPASITAIEWLYKADANPEKKFVRYEKGGHGADMFPVHPELPGMIVDWYVTTLIKTPGHAGVPKDTPALPKEIAVLDRLDQPGGASQVGKELAAARRQDPKATLFREDLVNFMGYEHLQSGQTQEAIEILKLNAAAYPDSPNVYDSLADAYLAAGQKDLALQNAKKALAMLASDTVDNEQRKQQVRESAEEKLKRLEGNAH